MNNFLHIKSLEVAYGSTIAFSNISFNIEKGESVSIIGHSGCGKSTLLHAISNLIPLKSGTIDSSFDSSQCTIMFQKEYLLPWKNVKNNILLNYSSKEYGSRSEYLMNTFNIDKLAHRYPHQLSGGEKQRVALARSLLRQPTLLLLDEPLASLDEQTREALQLEIKLYTQQHDITLLLVTHSISEALFMGKKVLVMKNSKITHSISNPLYNNKNMRSNDQFFKLEKVLRNALNEGENIEKD